MVLERYVASCVIPPSTLATLEGMPQIRSSFQGRPAAEARNEHSHQRVEPLAQHSRGWRCRAIEFVASRTTDQQFRNTVRGESQSCEVQLASCVRFSNRVAEEADVTTIGLRE